MCGRSGTELVVVTLKSKSILYFLVNPQLSSYNSLKRDKGFEVVNSSSLFPGNLLVATGVWAKCTRSGCARWEYL